MINNRNVAVICLAILSIGILSSLGYIIENNFLIKVSEIAFPIFFLLSFILLLANSTLVSDSKYFNTLLIATFFPPAIALAGLAINFISLPILIGAEIAGVLGVMIIYWIRFYNKINKIFFDHIKLHWVISTYLISFIHSTFRIMHYPYQDALEMLQFLPSIALFSYFYYHGFKEGYLFEKK